MSIFKKTIMLGGCLIALAQLADANAAAPNSNPLGSLKTIPIPEPSNLAEFVADKPTAIALGKALFWDMQVGSDGVQSCASCHFHAGTDNRSKNQLHPGPEGLFAKGVNYQLTSSDFPFHKLGNVDNRDSIVLSDIDDIAGSQGVFLAQFNSVTPGSAVDNTTLLADPKFNINGINVRQVTGRNTPSVINAVFNFRNFWDGSAQNIFNGVNPFGLRDPNARVFQAIDRKTVQAVNIRLDNASLASQAVGPPISSVEESATGRTFPDIGEKLTGGARNKFPREIGKKLRSLAPLGKQLVAYDDSVLGPYAFSSATTLKPGLKISYERLIKRAFQPKWWNSAKVVNISSNGLVNLSDSNPVQTDPTDPYPILQPSQLAKNQFTQMDQNFALFMGLAVQLYEATLISNNAPIDQYFEGNTAALTTAQLNGKAVFEGKGQCVNCHGGAEFTNASVRNVKNERLERMVMGDGGEAVYDNGFYNIGVRPTTDDLGLGNNDPFGHPLSESWLAKLGLFEQLLGASPNISVSPTDRIAADGAFKTPTLRNIALTAPYFHNGGESTLQQVVEFYNRGGDFHDQNIDNLDADIQNLGLTDTEKANLVTFLSALTDERVRFDKAPFDHPQLFIPNGHSGNTIAVTNDGTGKATDSLLEIKAVGKNGNGGTANFLGLP
jgi:cytochrome c peroxidase